MENKKLDLIDRKELVRLYSLWVGQLQAPEDVGDLRGVQTCLDVLIEQPNVDVAPVVHGRWHDIYQVSSWCSTGRCSACEQVAILPIRGLGTPYCPNCGAKMDGDNK